MAPSCPQCNCVDGLTSVIERVFISEGDEEDTWETSEYRTRITDKIQCENCLWIGEADELGDADGSSD